MSPWARRPGIGYAPPVLRMPKVSSVLAAALPMIVM